MLKPSGIWYQAINALPSEGRFAKAFHLLEMLRTYESLTPTTLKSTFTYDNRWEITEALDGFLLIGSDKNGLGEVGHEITFADMLENHQAWVDEMKEVISSARKKHKKHFTDQRLRHIARHRCERRALYEELKAEFEGEEAT